jgi:hypothetical protein
MEQKDALGPFGQRSEQRRIVGCTRTVRAPMLTRSELVRPTTSLVVATVISPARSPAPMPRASNTKALWRRHALGWAMAMAQSSLRSSGP